MKQKTSLIEIIDRLTALAEKQPKVFRDFYTVELEYAEKFNKTMMEATNLFPNQQLREAYVKDEIMNQPIFERYHEAKFEYDTLVYQTKVYQTIARLLQSESFRDYAIGGGA